MNKRATSQLLVLEEWIRNNMMAVDKREEAEVKKKVVGRETSRSG